MRSRSRTASAAPNTDTAVGVGLTIDTARPFRAIDWRSSRSWQNIWGYQLSTASITGVACEKCGRWRSGAWRVRIREACKPWDARNASSPPAKGDPAQRLLRFLQRFRAIRLIDPGRLPQASRANHRSWFALLGAGLRVEHYRLLVEEAGEVT